MAETKNAATLTINVPMDSIIADYDFNIRSRHGKKGEETYRGIDELAEDIKRNGQIVPGIARPATAGKFKLIAGFRRYEALRKLGAETMSLSMVDADDVRAAILNAKENTSRDGITPYDFAKRCIELRDRYGLSQAKIAAEFAAGTDFEGQGMSRSYIGNIMRCVEKLHPDILNAWKDQDLSVPPVAMLIKWATMEHDEQIANWDEYRGKDDEEGSEEGEESSEPGDKKNVARKASAGNMIAALRAVKNDPKLSETVQDAMLAVFAFALGKTKSLRLGSHVVYDPKAEKERIKQEKEAEREAAKAEKEAEREAEKAKKEAAKAKKEAEKAAKEKAEKK